MDGVLQAAFAGYFGAGWDEVLDAFDKSFAYSAENDGYFSVRGLRRLENVTLEELLEKGVPVFSVNILAS
ncbi:MAG: hypothetical protein ACP5SH_26490 [Syntrophobacteraceae bacterium]